MKNYHSRLELNMSDSTDPVRERKSRRTTQISPDNVEEPKSRKIANSKTSPSESTNKKSSSKRYNHCLYQKLYDDTNQRSARQIDCEQLSNKMNDLPAKFPEQIQQINETLYSLVLYHYYTEAKSFALCPYDTTRKKRQIKFDLMKYPARLRLILDAFIEELSDS